MGAVNEVIAMEGRHGSMFVADLVAFVDSATMRRRADEARQMITEAAIFAALDKPRSLYSIQQRVVGSAKDTEELQIALMRLRDEKKVTFDIHTGRWSR